MKDQTRNIETFKVGANHINEFDFHKHQGEMRPSRGQDQASTPQQGETTSERVARLTKQAHEKVVRKKRRK